MNYIRAAPVFPPAHSAKPAPEALRSALGTRLKVNYSDCSKPLRADSVQTLSAPVCEWRHIRQFLTEAHRGATLWARRVTEALG